MHGFTVQETGLPAGFAGPRVFAIVKVGGHRVFSILVDADPARVTIGQRVRLDAAGGRRRSQGQPAMAPRVHTVGVISDTHGLRAAGGAGRAGRRRAHRARGRHRRARRSSTRSAGSRPSPRCAATTTARRWAAGHPGDRRASRSASVSLYVLHDLHELDLDPRAAGFAAVIAGHSHQPRDGGARRRALSESRQRRAATLQAADLARPPHGHGRARCRPSW